ncbi:MAPEG family protein [Alloalcanivorax sp. C16-2]|uniref:MAPEG family protein n=1 Tax=Alloalcanivorax TaxID=3020832 RepID=UPI00193441D9|nr:MAPEG family protein [Alloalcanivorax marinus]MBL7250705.1 MAPEG family protein [Alloalcanivorax marinus]
MTLAFWCVLVAFLLPFAFTGFAKFQGGFGLRENHNPREFLETLSGARKRAHWAQQNSFEINPAFAAAVIIAQLAHTAPQGTIDGIAVAFVLSRVLYGVCYIADWASARSLVWFFGMGCIIALFVGTAG